MRGLGCPVRFHLTAGHRGDAPQAGPLIEGLPADVVMADTAYDADHLRQVMNTFTFVSCNYNDDSYRRHSKMSSFLTEISKKKLNLQYFTWPCKWTNQKGPACVRQ